MIKYRITPDAELDIVEIQQYTIAQWGQEQSEKYIDNLIATVELLADNPLIGRARPDVNAKTYSFSHDKHIIYYVVKLHYVVIIGVLGAAMLPKPHLTGRETT